MQRHCNLNLHFTRISRHLLQNSSPFFHTIKVHFITLHNDECARLNIYSQLLSCPRRQKSSKRSFSPVYEPKYLYLFGYITSTK